MKIMYVLPNLAVGGAETLVVSHLIALKSRGMDVCLFVDYKNHTVLHKRLRDNGITVICVASQVIKSTSYGARIVNRIIRESTISIFRRKTLLKAILVEKPNVIHFHLYTLPYIKDIPKYNASLFYTYHSDVQRYIKIYGKKWTKNITEMSNNDLMVSFAINHKMLSDVKRYISAKNIFYMPNSIDVNEVSRKSYSHKCLCESLGLSENSFLIGHVGRMLPVKNQKKSIAILKCVLEKIDNAYLLFVGDGNKKYIRLLDDYADELGIKSHIIHLGFRVDVNEIIGALDCGILPSIKEGFPITVLEYQAHNIRTVTSNAVESELLCNNNAFRLGIDDCDTVWANYIIGTFTNDITGDIYSFDTEKIIERLLWYYNIEGKLEDECE